MTELVQPTAIDPVSPEIMIFPGDHRYDQARQAWNLAVDQRPPVVALPRTTAEVQAVVDYARTLDLRLAIQGTGHGAAARRALTGTVLVNMACLTGLEVDPVARVARVRAGTVWADVVAAAAEHGLAALHGSASDVGVVGYSLGGGIGWLARRYGLSSSSVLGAEVVTAAGEVVRADAHENADLFWALRGGGGSFGIVTEIEIALYPVAEAYAGWLIWPIEQADAVLCAWAEWTRTVPDELTSVGRIMQIPPIEEMPEPLRGRQIVVVEAAYLGAEPEGRALLQPLLDLDPEIDTFSTAPAAALAHLHQDPPHPVPGVGNGWLLGELDGEAAETLVAAAAMDGTSPLLSVEIRHLGGALGRPDPRGGALTHIEAPYALFAVGAPMGSVTVGAIDAAIDDLAWRLAPWSSGGAFLNLTDRPTPAAAFFPDEVLERLASIREEIDPERRLRPNHAI
jgi:FAD/FMN-containing dehydrogenase